MPVTKHAIDFSASNPESQPFWTAAAEGRFIIPTCSACGRTHWYPRIFCPFCFSDKTEWEPASGKGRIYSYSVMRAATVPYAIAYVTLKEGPTMLTNIVDCNLDTLKIGQDVKLVFKISDEGVSVPMFKPV